MYTYMIVDDEPLIRRGIKKKLQPLQEREGLVCCAEASNGKRALELMEEKNPDVVITDMKMPIMDGKEFLPILAERYPDTYIIVISGYQDFAYSRHALRANAIDYLLKPVRAGDLAASMERAIQMKREKTNYAQELARSRKEQEASCYQHDLDLLTNLVLGYHTGCMELTSERLMFVESMHRMLLLTLHGEAPVDMPMLEDYLAENGFGDLALCLQHANTDTLGFLILFVSEKSRLSSRELSRQVVRGIQQICEAGGVPVSIGVSGVHGSLTELYDAFLESVDALNRKYPNEKNKCYFSEGGEDRPGAVLAWAGEEELLFRIEAGMADQVPALLDWLFAQAENGPDYTIQDIKQYCYRLAGRVRYMAVPYLNQNWKGEASVNGENVLNTMFSLKELREYYGRLFVNLSRAIGPASVYTSDDLAENISRYVQRNYDKDLTVEFIASLFNINRNYCSTVFRQKKGTTLVNYIHEVRIGHARELLEKTDKKLYQISRSVGYENVKYFFRVFKKYTRLSPEQYRKQFGKARL